MGWPLESLVGSTFIIEAHIFLALVIVLGMSSSSEALLMIATSRALMVASATAPGLALVEAIFPKEGLVRGLEILSHLSLKASLRGIIPNLLLLRKVISEQNSS